jgi:uncharacterized membrane protein YqiK
MQRRINEAEGKAEEILMIAKATAESIKKMAQTLSMQGGEEAFRLKLSEKYFKQMGHLANERVEIIMPGRIQDFNDWMKNLGLNK